MVRLKNLFLRVHHRTIYSWLLCCHFQVNGYEPHPGITPPSSAKPQFCCKQRTYKRGGIYVSFDVLQEKGPFTSKPKILKFLKHTLQDTEDIWLLGKSQSQNKNKGETHYKPFHPKLASAEAWTSTLYNLGNVYWKDIRLKSSGVKLGIRDNIHTSLPTYKGAITKTWDSFVATRT